MKFQLSDDSNPGILCFPLSLCDWSRKLTHSLNQSDAKVKPIVAWSPAFSRTLGSLVGFSLSSHLFFRVFSFPLTGFCDYCGFGFYETQSKGALFN